MFVTEHMNAQTDLTTAVIGFCRFLRRQSFRVGVAETLAALEACRVGPLDQRSYLRAALRALLCSSRQENEQFDPLFDNTGIQGLTTWKTANDDHLSIRWVWLPSKAITVDLCQLSTRSQ